MKTIRNSTRGTTMVEVLVAFVVLVLLMGIFSQALGLSGRMMNRSSDMQEEYRELAGDYYLDRLGTGESKTPSVTLRFKRVTKDGNPTGDGFSMKAEIRTYTKGGVSLFDVRHAEAAESEAE